jgi:glyoxylase-like metal-dependent hydrolase (beta-lactamase superfamily II)
VTLHRDIAPGVHRVAEAFVNWYLVEDDAGVTVVDAALPRCWDTLLTSLDTLGRSRDDVRAVVLTHAHFDHVGFAERARTELGVPVYCHAEEVWLTRHPWRYKTERSPAPYLLKPATAARFTRFLLQGGLRVPKVKEVTTFADGDVLPVPGRPAVVFTPGHTFGHSALHLRDRDASLVGDAIVTLDPYTGRTGPRLVARAATADSAQARASAERLAGLTARVMGGGHGEEWTDGIAEAAQRALAEPHG